MGQKKKKSEQILHKDVRMIDMSLKRCSPSQFIKKRKTKTIVRYGRRPLAWLRCSTREGTSPEKIYGRQIHRDAEHRGH